MVRRARGDLLGASGLANETFLRLLERSGYAWKNRPDFFRLAVRAMRDVLVDEARRHSALKRGGHLRRVPLSDGIPAPNAAFERLDLEAAFDALEKADRMAHDAFVLGTAEMTWAEIATALGVAKATVGRAIKRAKKFLCEWLGDEESQIA